MLFKRAVLGFVFILPIVVVAQNFNVLTIPDSLTKDADVVKRFDELIFEIKSPGKAVTKEHHVYTIMNEDGDEFGKYRTYYGSFTSINYVSGKLYDAGGKELKHIKTKDMKDMSTWDGISLADDSRVKINDFYYRNYPYTVDYEEEDEIDGLKAIPSWEPISEADLSVQYSRYVVIAPKEYNVRYKLLNGAIAPVITENGDKKIYTWEMKNMPARKSETWAPTWNELVPIVLCAPSDFELSGYKGNLSSWLNFGKFIGDLKKGRDILPDDIKQKVHELTENVQDKKEKVKILYDFLQKNTRYISVQLGIGGWQPFDAKYVASNKYGDCKALSNFMVALLKEAGIKANYVVIKAGANEEPLIEDFPSFTQFNHIVTCVPTGKDSMWLECTSQTVAPGFMGTFTGNRKAILIDDDGGHIVSTPNYTLSDNLISRKVIGTVDLQGNLDANIYTRFKGIREESAHFLMYDHSKEEQGKILNKSLNLATYSVDKPEFTEIKSALPEINESLHLVSNNYATVSGKRLFIEPNIVNKSPFKFTVIDERKNEIVYNYAFKDIDTVEIKIPDGYIPESMPKDVTIAGKYGSYNISYKIENNLVKLVRIYEQPSGRYPKTDFPEFAKFYNDIYKADRAKIVLVKKES